MKIAPIARKMPVARLIVLGELFLLANEHFRKLDPQERHRVVELVRRGHGRPRNLSDRERRELSRLMEKAEPREFVKRAAGRMVGLGKRPGGKA